MNLLNFTYLARNMSYESPLHLLLSPLTYLKITIRYLGSWSKKKASPTLLPAIAVHNTQGSWHGQRWAIISLKLGMLIREKSSIDIITMPCVHKTCSKKIRILVFIIQMLNKYPGASFHHLKKLGNLLIISISQYNNQCQVMKCQLILNWTTK